jgi:hypothetical protein
VDELVSAILPAVFRGFSSGFGTRGDITDGVRDCRRESETPLFPVSRACSILVLIRVPDISRLEKRGNMQEIVVQSTKYPEIVVQGSKYDYTSDIVLVVVGILAAAAIIWRYTATRRGKD